MTQAPPSSGPASRVPDSRSPLQLMQAALHEARKAERIGEVPIGAVIARNGQIIARGHNRRETRQDVTLHAELVAIRTACRRLRSWRLDGCELYVTLEPCVMCAGAIVQARIKTVVFGATDPKAGAVGSITNVFDLRQNHQVAWQGGLLKDECSAILRDFFAVRRQLDKATGSRALRRAAAVAAAAGTAKGAPNTEKDRHAGCPGESNS